MSKSPYNKIWRASGGRQRALCNRQLSHKAGQGFEGVVGDRLEDGTDLGPVDNLDAEVVVVGDDSAVQNRDRLHFAARIFLRSDLKV